jgi:hypothetical protein
VICRSRPSRRGGGARRLHATRCRLEVECLEDRNLLSFQVLATLGDPVSPPTGPAFRLNDFEPGALNNRGDVLYGDDLGTANDPGTTFGEGVFLRRHGQEMVLANSTALAPGGGTFDAGFLGTSTLNDRGDAGFVFLLQPFTLPFGVNAGVFRYSHNTQTVTQVVQPGVTLAPGGVPFAGASWSPVLDDRGDLFFVGIVPSDKGIHIPNEPYVGLGMGIFKVDLAGHITSIVSPGDPAPGGGTFDAAGLSYSAGTWVNDRGDVVFDAHVAGEEAKVPGGVPGFPPDQATFIAALGSVYVKSGVTGKITSVAHAGDPAPGGGVFRQALFPEINDRGDVLFTGDLTPAPDANQVLGVFLRSGGKIIPIARPGDPMPGGGHLLTASVRTGNTHLNDEGDVVFTGLLDTDVNHDGVPDTGLFEWSHGKVSLIARTGTVLRGVGTVENLNFGGTSVQPLSFIPNSGVVNNDQGQVLFGATLADGRGVLLLDTPGHDQEGEQGDGPHGEGQHGGSVLGDTAGTGLEASRPAAAAGATRLTDAALVALATSTVAPPSVESSAALTVHPASQAVRSPALLAGRDNGGLPLPSSQTVTGLAGALTHRAVDALFADLGTNPLGDPFTNGPL